jgi:hypothetical protein
MTEVEELREKLSAAEEEVKALTDEMAEYEEELDHWKATLRLKVTKIRLYDLLAQYKMAIEEDGTKSPWAQVCYELLLKELR